MMETSQQGIIIPQLCSICLDNANLSCTICYNAHYCSREHQLQDLPDHQGVCRKESFYPSQSTSSNVQMDSLNSYLEETWCQNNLPSAKPDELGMYQPIFDPTTTPNTDNRPTQLGQSLEDELFSCFTSEFLSSDNNLWDLINSSEVAQNIFDEGVFLEKDPVPPIQQEPQSESSSTQQVPDKKVLNLMGGASLQSICSNVVRDLTKYGICVLDKFLGEKLGNLILQEVCDLYRKGIFKKGELVVPNPYTTKENIRSDVTTWVNGTEPECVYVGHLMQVLDIVMTTCNKLEDGGALSKYKLHRRTKAMIACYPGDGTHYKKHIDNPHKDGRCVTCIYYLNKNWNIRKDGGMLRMFPSIMENDVAEIEPIFDRMIFFWSDKRNPHEVLRAFRTRFAITVWYFDADERDRALMKSRDRVRGNATSQRSMNKSIK